MNPGTKTMLGVIEVLGRANCLDVNTYRLACLTDIKVDTE